MNRRTFLGLFGWAFVGLGLGDWRLVGKTKELALPTTDFQQQFVFDGVGLVFTATPMKPTGCTRRVFLPLVLQWFVQGK